MRRKYGWSQQVAKLAERIIRLVYQHVDHLPSEERVRRLEAFRAVLRSVMHTPAWRLRH
jgi:hypothetical protein